MTSSVGDHGRRAHLKDAAITFCVGTGLLWSLYLWTFGETLGDFDLLISFLEDFRIRIIVSVAGGFISWSLLTPYRKVIADFSGRALEEILTPVIGEFNPLSLPAPIRNLSPIYWPHTDEGKKQCDRTLSQQLNTIDPILFERVIAVLLRLEGYHSEVNGGREADGGVDIRATDLKRELTNVQCKRYVRDRVGAPFIRKLLGTMKRDGAQHGLFVNLSGFLLDAYPVARRNNIALWGGNKIKELILRHRDSLPDSTRRYIAERRPSCVGCKRMLSYVDRDEKVLVGAPHWTGLEKDGGCGCVIPYFGRGLGGGPGVPTAAGANPLGL